MSYYDAGNALFEAVGAVLTWMNFVRLRRDRIVLGVYWPVTAFFAAWGVWNLFYYPSVGHYWSAAIGAVLCTGNVAWVVLALKLMRKEKLCLNQ